VRKNHPHKCQPGRYAYGIKMNTPRELVDQLISIFPEFLEEWDEGESFGGIGVYNYHTVLIEFAPISYRMLNGGTPNQIKKFCDLINHMVEMGGDQENAVSTCFLEHASQIGVRKIIKPYLSKEAEQELR
jgi:hypothetical protein